VNQNLNGQQFVKQVHKTGGASANAQTGRMVRPGESGFFVGGEPDRGGNQIPAAIIPEKDFKPEHVEEYAKKVSQATGNRHDVHIGGWKNEGKVYLDASARVPRGGEAVRKGKARGELAVWDNKHGKEIPTSKAKGNG
jgi:hypothetical protein